MEGFTCFWRMVNIDLSDPFKITSPPFNIEMLGDSQWDLELRPTSSDFIGLSLFKIEPFKIKSSVAINISILTKIGWMSMLHNRRNKFEGGGLGFGTQEFLNCSNNLSMGECLPNGCLTIGIKLSNKKTIGKSAQVLITSRVISKENVVHLPVEKFQNLRHSDFLNFPDMPQSVVPESKKESNTIGTQTDSTNILDDSKDIIHLFKEKKFQFVTLQTATREFSVHKDLLSARSPVFNAMFDMPMKENHCNHVQIKDVDNGTLSAMLQFLHFEPLPDLQWNDAAKLYYAADKYQIETLKAKCVSILEMKISVETICEAFVLSDMHRDITLRNFAQEYFNKNSKYILRSSKWKDLLVSNPEIASEILLQFSEKL